MSPPEYRPPTMYCPNVSGLACGGSFRSDHSQCHKRATEEIRALWKKIELEKRTSS